MSALTEAEAHERWCPFVRFVVDVPQYASGNRFDDGTSGQLAKECRCIASVCMAWRWNLDDKGQPAYQRTKVPNMSGHFNNAPMGFCGLAGRPL